MAASIRVEGNGSTPASAWGVRPPSLSVVMPVHNAAPYLDESVESILTQTFTDFELVVVDDGSTDGSTGLLRDWTKRDDRVRLIENPVRLGIARNSDRVVREARALVCARMDADDVSCPTRLELEWQALEARPDASLVGTLWEGIDAAGRVVRPRDRWRLTRRSSFAPFPHGSIMFRRAAYEAVGGYRTACDYWEDLDLYLRLAARGPVLVVPAALYRYRFHEASTLGGPIRPDEERATELMLRCLAVRREGGDYTPLLAGVEGAPGRATPGVSPAALYLLAARRLWAGEPPRIRQRLSAVGSRRPSLLWLGLVVLATVGEVAPWLVRAGLTGFVRLRDALAGVLIRKRSVVEWRFE